MKAKFLRSIVSCAISVFIALVASAANAAFVDFNDITGTPAYVEPNGSASLEYGGFLFTGPHIHTPGGITDDIASHINSNGTTVIGYEATSTGAVGAERFIQMSRVDGDTFDLYSLDAAEFGNHDETTDYDHPNAQFIDVTGYYLDGQSLSFQLELDYIYDGSGSVVDFQHFTLPEPFLNVTSIVFTGLRNDGLLVDGYESGGMLLDNIEVGATATEINADFDSGSIGSYSIDGNEIDLTLRTEEFTNPSANPYYTYWTNFVVSGVQDQEITINITNGDDVPFLTGLDGSGIPKESQMVYTCDGLNWNRLTNYSYAAGTGTYTFTETFPCDDVQIATFFPFSYGYMHDYVDYVSSSEWAAETVLGQSEQGRDIDLLTITNTAIPAGDKTDIYIIGRQHSGEVASSHMLEGMIDFLISDDPDAQIMRDDFVWYIVPMVNPDGVFEGNSRATSLLRDPNRDWHPLNTESVEINIVRQHLESINAANGIEMFIDWHSQMSDDRWYNFVYSPPGNTFFDTLSTWTNFDAQEAVDPICVEDSCTARGYATVELGLPTFGFEPTPHHDTWTIESLQQEGVNVAYAIAIADNFEVPNQPPEIISTPITTATEGALYNYDVEATDPNSLDTTTFSLDTSPTDMQIDPVSGLITWTPAAVDAGVPQDVSVRAEDDNGLFDTQEFTIIVSGPQPNLPPEVTSTPITTATEGVLYNYDVEATEPNSSDTITFSLDTSPIGMQIDPVSGLTTWTPSATDVGVPQDVVIRAEDDHGLFDTQDFTISVAGPQPNLPPEITSTPTTTASEGVLYSYDVEATDPDPSDTITFSLSLSPIGMQIDPVSGLITWTPTMAQLGGPHDVTIVAQDNGDPLGSATQEFAITVEESGEPEISIIGPSDYELGTVQLLPDTTYTYIDDIYMWFTAAPEQYIGLPFIRTAQNDRRVYAEEFLSFQVDQPVVVYVCHSTQISAPVWLSDNFSLNGDQVTIRGQAFEVWQREYPAGEIVLGGNRAVGETSGPGAMYSVIIAELAGPLAPQVSFMAEPRAGVAPFDVVFTDQSSGDIISWLWDFGDGETSTLQNPTHTYDSLPGTYSVTLDVSGPGGTDSLTEIDYITIEDNLAPSITSTAITEASQDRLYSYDVEATDPNASDTITFSLDTSPIGMQIDPVSGLITWTPVAADVGVPQDVIVRAEDDHGLFDNQDFTITVAGPQPNLPPEITSTPTTAATEGVLYSYDVEATDPDPSDTITFSLSLSPIGMQIDLVSGLITWTPTMAQLGGPHDVTIVVQDNGDPQGSDTQEFAITVEESGEPEISIIGPSDYELGTVQLPPDTTYTYIDDIYMWFTAAPEQYIGLPFIRTAQNDRRVYAEEFLTFQVSQPVVVYVCHSTQVSTPAWLSDNFSLNGDQVTIRGQAFEVWQREYPAGEIVLGGNRAVGETSGPGAMYSVIIAELAGPLAPQASFMAAPRAGVAPFDVLFTDQSSGDIISWLWDFGDGETSTLQNPAHTYDSLPGTYSVTLDVSGPGGTDSLTEIDYITIEDNLAPSITSTAITEASQDRLYSYDVEATDPNASDTITFSLDTSPIGMQIDPVSGLTTWTPSAADVGVPQDVSVRAEDDHGLFYTQGFTISVAGPQPNLPPEITSTPTTTASEGVLYSYDVEATDPDPSDTITFSLSLSPIGMQIDPVSGLITWTPTMAQLGGPHDVTIVAQDNGDPLGSATQEFAITVEESGEPEISIIGPSDYELGTVQLLPDTTYTYIDDIYMWFTAAPEQYIGLPFIRTAQNDRRVYAEEFLTFQVSQPVVVYVCHSTQVSAPAWLSDNFSLNGDQFIIRGQAFEVWQREYPAGDIILGGNRAIGETTESGAMYVVIIQGN